MGVVGVPEAVGDVGVGVLDKCELGSDSAATRAAWPKATITSSPTPASSKSMHTTASALTWLGGDVFDIAWTP